VAEEEKDKAATRETPTLGAGKDLLFGWLVGRAAADLGLAQALALSEAQRAEQMKRLEDSLLAQIRELQSRTDLGASWGEQFAELSDLAAKVEGVAERLGQVETIAAQAVQNHDPLQTHTAKWQSELAHQQALHEAQSLRLREISEGLTAQIRDLEKRMQDLAQDRPFTAADFPGLADVSVQIGALTARLEEAELAHRRLETRAADAVERVREQAAAVLRNENAALKAELFEQLKKLETPHRAIADLAASLDQRMENLRRELDDSVASRVAQELDGLRRGLQVLTERLDAAPAPLVDLDAARERWMREVDQHVRRLGDDLRQELCGVASSKVDQAVFQVEIRALGDRLAKAERAAREASENVAAEIGAIRDGLGRQQVSQQATAELLRGIQDTLRVKLEEVQNLRLRPEAIGERGEAQWAALKTEAERLAQRMTEVESAAHHAHELLIHESEQSVQLRETLRAEIDELRGRLNERPLMSALVAGVESRLSARLQELESRLSEKIPLVDRRDREIGELKAEIRAIDQKMARLEAANAPPWSASNRTRETVEPAQERLRALVQPSPVKPQPRPSGSPLGQAIGSADSGAREQVLVEAGKDQIAQLHERISADIERARAELREKSGRWKARR